MYKIFENKAGERIVRKPVRPVVEAEDIIMEKSNEIFEGYLKKHTFKERIKQPKFWTTLLIIAIGIFLLIQLVLMQKGSISTDELQKSIKIVWQNSQWVNKEITPYEVKVVPSITFKIKNIGKRTIKNVKFVGVFEFTETGDQIGDGVTPLLKKPLKPGETSNEIFIKSLYGYSATSKEAFLKNEAEWKDIKVKVFAKTNAGFANLGIFPVKKEIEGIKEDFKSTEEAVDSEKAKMSEELGRSIQVDSQKTYWVDKKVATGKAVIVPAISFQIKNVGTNPLHHIIFKGTFLFEESGKLLSEGIKTAIDNPLSPGKISDGITLSAEFGYTASTKAAFIKNIQNWQRIKVKLFAKTKLSGYALLGTYPVSRDIEGVRVVYGDEEKNEQEKRIP